jgi:PAS domain S-box-containing protein
VVVAVWCSGGLCLLTMTRRRRPVAGNITTDSSGLPKNSRSVAGATYKRARSTDAASSQNTKDALVIYAASGAVLSKSPTVWQYGGMKDRDRRRVPQPALTPAEILEQMPALVVLERIPVPTIAITGDGTILFANPAAAEMLGYPKEKLLAMKFHDIFRAPASGSVIAALQANADKVVELAHADGSIVRAKMSGSALLRGDDPVALATFQDLTEALWAKDF